MLPWSPRKPSITILNFSWGVRFFRGLLIVDSSRCPLNLVSYVNWDQYTISPEVKFLLGLLYYQGAGTAQDFAKAAQYIKEAADAGDPSAAQFLGYQNGRMPDYGMPLEELLKLLWENQ